MKTEINAGEVGQVLVLLAESLTVEGYQVTVTELLEVMEGRVLACKETHDVKAYLGCMSG